MILFPRRTAVGQVEPARSNDWIERFGLWNYFLMVATTIGAIVVGLAAIVFNMLGLM
ncbi:hypothetical protein [Phage ST231]|nr:hypothetical protein [Phage ST231]